MVESTKELRLKNQSDEQLALLAKEGSDDAISELYRRWFSRLRAFACRYVGNQHEAEDLVQELFLKWVNRPELFDSAKSFSSWIFVSLRNQCLNLLRNDKTRRTLAELHFNPDPLVSFQNGMDAQKLKLELAEWYKTLSEKERLVFVLRFEHQLPLKEISEIAGIPEGSVKSCLYYLLKKVSPIAKMYTHE